MYRYNYLKEKTFVEHLSDYIGETVTIHTTASGSNSSFTGVLLKVNSSYIRLLTAFGPASDCRAGRCRGCAKSNCRYSGYYTSTDYMSSVADIPIDQIVSLVHNKI
ncbi:MAG TPA: hypothetical protein GXX17_04400 [Clostridiales bacterium]|nr:hypothetical protein [Clostridiales bacterium]